MTHMLRFPMRRFLLPLFGATAFSVMAFTPAPALAATNQQSGLVNVNLQAISLQAPIAVAVPVGVAANVCAVDAAVLAQQAATGPASCTATGTSRALNTAIASSMTGGGNQSNQQSGLVNVNVQGLNIQAPVSVAVPIGIAANVCGVDAALLAAQDGTGGAACTATSNPQALSSAIARQLAA